MGKTQQYLVSKVANSSQFKKFEDLCLDLKNACETTDSNYYKIISSGQKFLEMESQNQRIYIFGLSRNQRKHWIQSLKDTQL